MRIAFVETLCESAQRDERIWLVANDLGYSVLEKFIESFPNRYVNAGVAEQNMMGISAGIALSGKVVFVYSIGNFPTLRCLEQIRNDVCYHKANVKIVAVGGGLSYGSLGYTHHAIEDIAIMRALPNMTVLAPGDPVETRLAVKFIAESNGPCYLRLGKAGESIVHKQEPVFKADSGIVLQESSEGVALISTGAMLKMSADIAQELEKEGIKPSILSIPILKPFPKDFVIPFALKNHLFVVLEEHSNTGGLFEVIASTLADANAHPKILRVNLGEGMSFDVGSQNYLRKQKGLEVKTLVREIRQVLSLSSK